MASLRAKTVPPCLHPGEPPEMGLARLSKYDHINGLGIALPPKRQCPSSLSQSTYVNHKAEGLRDRAILGTKHCHPKTFRLFDQPRQWLVKRAPMLLGTTNLMLT